MEGEIFIKSFRIYSQISIRSPCLFIVMSACPCYYNSIGTTAHKLWLKHSYINRNKKFTFLLPLSYQQTDSQQSGKEFNTWEILVVWDQH